MTVYRQYQLFGSLLVSRSLQVVGGSFSIRKYPFLLVCNCRWTCRLSANVDLMQLWQYCICWTVFLTTATLTQLWRCSDNSPSLSCSPLGLSLLLGSNEHAQLGSPALFIIPVILHLDLDRFTQVCPGLPRFQNNFLNVMHTVLHCYHLPWSDRVPGSHRLGDITAKPYSTVVMFWITQLTPIVTQCYDVENKITHAHAHITYGKAIWILPLPNLLPCQQTRPS